VLTRPHTIQRSIGAVLFLLASVSVGLAADLTGRASVIDADTIEIHGTRIRLWGIDAPESTQLCRDAGLLPYGKP
jgi:endonuclease YncB( thermonuclease family)